ncbi:MAG: HNH endonuclease, partial [Nocardioides sp.]|nr:HNH endonuclease [Nocardioides sp.]
RLACEAHLIPAVLGGESEVLDLGRARRLHTRAMRLARLVEQPTCEQPTCDVPATACHAHHRTPWARGGTTAKHTLEWLCPHHHRQTHATDTVRRT